MSARSNTAQQEMLLHNRGEFWTAKQRDAHSLHEISYRACFKPQLPRWFIEHHTRPDDVVYDPFSGRGTTALETALLDRRVIANDINPLSRILTEPRLDPPAPEAVTARLEEIPYDESARADQDLSMFYHPRTEAEIISLRNYLRARRSRGEEDALDRWIRMVATNRLTGHSPGFFSVYSFPPNQAVSAKAQQKINQRRAQTPEYRDTRKLILRKTRALLKDLIDAQATTLRKAASSAKFLECDARATPLIADASVQLTVTSPPFLDVVQYADDNWLRGWFNALPVEDIASRITMARRIEDWSAVMAEVFRELNRITHKNGIVAFEVGEVRKGQVKLEEHVVPLGLAAGFSLQEVMLHEQRFTKTANIWGVANNRSGTNSHRIVVFRRP